MEALAKAYSLLSALSTCEPPTGHQKIPSALWEPLSSPQDWQTITAQDMALLQNLGYLVPLRSRFPAPVIPVWNQADTPAVHHFALNGMENRGVNQCKPIQRAIRNPTV